MIGIAILAGGGASRFGGIKQLVEYNGQTLVRRAINEAVQVPNGRVSIITGAYAADVEAHVGSFGVDSEVLFNADWEKGLSTSIHRAVNWAVECQYDGLLLMCCDQPKISAAHLQALISAGEPEKHIACARYANTVGVPAYFPSFVFPDLLTLQGDRGAKALFSKWSQVTIAISIPEAGLDVDYANDLLTLN